MARAASTVRFLFAVECSVHGILLSKNIFIIFLFFFCLNRTHANVSFTVFVLFDTFAMFCCAGSARGGVIHINLHYKMVCHSVWMKCSRIMSWFCICMKQLVQSLSNSRSFSLTSFFFHSFLNFYIHTAVELHIYILFQSTDNSLFCLWNNFFFIDSINI